MPPVSALQKMPSHIRAAVEQRQADNGFADIDGLHEYLTQLWNEYSGSRATTGRINQQLKEIMQEARERAFLSKALVEVMGDDLQDVALANTLMLDGIIQSILPYLNVSPAEIQELEPMAKLALLKEIGVASSRLSGNFEKLKRERRIDKAATASSGQNTSSDEYRQKLQERMERMLGITNEQLA